MERKELYTENYETRMKEMKDDIKRWRDIPCSWVGRINMVKRLHYQKQSKDRKQYQMTNGIFHISRTKKFTNSMETQKTPNSQSNFKKEE